MTAPTKPSARLSSGQAKDPVAVARAITRLAEGAGDNFGRVTLAVSPETQTEVSNPLVRAGAHISLTALSATAAAATGLWVEPANGGFTIHHNASAAADRDFSYGFTG